MTTQERKRLGLLWEAIELKLFKPASEAAQRRWCACFVRSLADFWEVEPPSVGSTFPKAIVNLPVPEFAIEYDLSNWDGSQRRASVRMLFGQQEVACHHMDHAFDDRIAVYDPPPGSVLVLYPNMRSRTDDLFGDICWVLDRFVVHPCAHLHPGPGIFTCLAIEDDAFCESMHEMRLGVGLTNPFAALFQYRLNFVLRKTPWETKAAKEAERNRVAAILRDAILGDRAPQGVAAGELFGCMR